MDGPCPVIRRSFPSPGGELTNWFMKESKRRGMAISLSDYTLGVGQGWAMDKMLAANPDLNGCQLALRSQTGQRWSGGV